MKYLELEKNVNYNKPVTNMIIFALLNIIKYKNKIIYNYFLYFRNDEDWENVKKKNWKKY